MLDRVKAAAERAEAQRRQWRLDVYIRDPSFQGDPELRREADIYINKQEIGRMVVDNHWDAKEGSQPRWSDKDIADKVTVIELLQEQSIGQG